MLVTGLAAIVIALGSAGPASASAACPGDEDIPTVETAARAGAALVCDLNALRDRHGLKPLRWDWHLWYAAQGMANDMARNRYVAHTSSDGRSPGARVADAGYISASPDWLVLETLGWADGQFASPLAIALGWMDSPDHRSKILDPDIDDLGVGLAPGAMTTDGPVGMFYAVDFGTRGSGAETTTPVAPAPGAPSPSPGSPTTDDAGEALPQPGSTRRRARACIRPRAKRSRAKRRQARARYGLCIRRR